MFSLRRTRIPRPPAPPPMDPPPLPTTPREWWQALDRAWAQGYQEGFRAGQAAGTLRAWAWGLWK